MNGYAGKILRVNLSTEKTATIPTSKYEHWVGGHGMGSAIFFDLVKDKTIDGFHPDNVVTMMTSPLSGTLAPAGGGRTEVQGIGVQSYPIGWFTRSNFGGRFSTHLKHAGWDGIVLEGRAKEPVWLDIRDDTVEIRNCASLSLWGMDTWQCQQTIWNYVAGDQAYGDWIDPGGRDWGQTTQRPAVVAIGPAGEKKSRMACLIHDASNGSGQGGFGAVWGSKYLKAISVIGTGAIAINDPRELLSARMWFKENYAFDLNDLKTLDWTAGTASAPVSGVLWAPPASENAPGPEETATSAKPRGAKLWQRPEGEGQRPQACVGCYSGCRARYESGMGNEASCVDTLVYVEANSLEIQRKATDLLNRYGLNAFEIMNAVQYVRALNKKGVLGPGEVIDCPLDFNDFGSYEFIERFVKLAAYGDDGCGNDHAFGRDLSEGVFRAAEKWNRRKEDLKTGLLPFPHWGLPVHYDPRVELEWGYGTILGDRDINEHDFNGLFWDPTLADWYGREPRATAEEAVRIYTDKMTVAPFQGDRRMLDFSDENMYSEHIAKLVAWHRYYTRFWKQSALFCDWRWPDFVNVYAPGKVGSTGEAEPRFLRAATGLDFTFEDGIELGRKIWNLDHAIWTLQGRDRGMVKFEDYIYDVPLANDWGPKCMMPGYKDGRWGYFDYTHRKLDREGVEEFKTRFYLIMGWDPDTGYPKRSTLERLGLHDVADALEDQEKLGKECHEQAV